MRAVGGRFKREGTYAYTLLIHIAVQQKWIQHCKAILFQLKNKFEKKILDGEETENKRLSLKPLFHIYMFQPCHWMWTLWKQNIEQIKTFQKFKQREMWKWKSLSCPTLCDPKHYIPPWTIFHGLHSSWNSPGHNTREGSHSLLQGIFPTQGSNPVLPHYRQILYWLSHWGSPRILEWVAYPFCSGLSQPRNQIGVSCIEGEILYQLNNQGSL